MDFVFFVSISFIQALYLAIGTFLLMAGGALLGNDLLWRIGGRRAKARIIGVRDNGGAYYTVYTVAQPGGADFQATAHCGSNLTEKRATGRPATLLYFRSNPTRVRDAGNLWFLMIGLILLAGGLMFVRDALAQAPVGWFAVILIPVIIGAVLFFKARPPSAAQAARFTEDEQTRLARLGPVRTMEDILAEKGPPPAGTPVPVFLTPLIIFAGLGLIGYSFYAALIIERSASWQELAMIFASGLLFTVFGIVTRQKR